MRQIAARLFVIAAIVFGAGIAPSTAMPVFAIAPSLAAEPRAHVQTASELMRIPFYRGCVQTMVGRAQAGLRGRYDPHFIIDFASMMCMSFMLGAV